MASPVQYVPIRLQCADERAGRKSMRDMLGRDWWRRRSRAAWAGFAAEHALARALNAVPGPMWCRLAPILAYDLALGRGPSTLAKFDMDASCDVTRVEVKTRAVPTGWTDTAKFDYVTVPTHEGREPIKAVGLVWFCWYSMANPRRLWVLGYLRGPAEFQRRAVFYRQGEPLPRGGWAKDGGAWVIEISQLRAFPRGMFLEDE